MTTLQGCRLGLERLLSRWSRGVFGLIPLLQCRGLILVSTLQRLGLVSVSRLYRSNHNIEWLINWPLISVAGMFAVCSRLLLLLWILTCEGQLLPPRDGTTPRWELPTDGWDSGTHTDRYPNPQTHYARCQQQQRSWLCDPNNMLTDAECQYRFHATSLY